ncbi:MAG: NYN domain-containing protein [Thermomicrobiales bacterium]|nr:NYN domain-containing protein [Thermomicrobiales bacterium]MCO5218634.1 NYN domain-containing protein [Thermomicrobiales bacterium]MCO5224311.1 NYN domain-containing protein [Thermomicrobiales bacterium]MCO5229050.1 NYN domain-containing protein [Thermomicrobiales bacterium]
MKTSIYVDGFNFYYGCYKHQQALCTPQDKWLDWRALGEILVGADSTLHRIHYFTAYIRRDLRDPEQNLRQERYLKAIEATPGLQIHYGKHTPVTRKGRLRSPTPRQLGWPSEVPIVIGTSEEKGSDVNLAVHLLNDAWSGDMDRAIVISNDTDLMDAIRLAKKHVRVDVVSPLPELSKQLRKVADYSWCLDVSLLRECRMDTPRVALDGAELYPPRSWQEATWPARRDHTGQIRQAIAQVAAYWQSRISSDEGSNED